MIGKSVRIGVALAGVLVGSSILQQTASAQVPADTLMGHNLLVNGDAEADAGAKGQGTIVAPKGWATTGEFTSVQYGASGGYPDASAPGPPNRGRNFFAGGDSEVSMASQAVDVALAGRGIDNENVTYSLSGWLGGYESQEDNTAIIAEFVDPSGRLMGTAKIGPVTAADRKAATGLLSRTVTGTVPKGSRAIRVTITAMRSKGSANHGYADNVSLVLRWKGM